MRVRDVMKGQPRFCKAWDDVATAGRTMTEVGCGVLPVLGDEHRVWGMVTDRDICCAVTRLDQKPSEMGVREVMSQPVIACRADDEIREALDLMREHKIRRLPVIDADGRLEGLIALDDIALEAKAFEQDRGDEPFLEEIALTLKALATHPALTTTPLSA